MPKSKQTDRNGGEGGGRGDPDEEDVMEEAGIAPAKTKRARRTANSKYPAESTDDTDWVDYALVVHSGLCSGHMTLARGVNGAFLVTKPEDSDIELINTPGKGKVSMITFDAYTQAEYEGAYDTKFSLQSLLNKLKPMVVDNIAVSTKGMWGYTEDKIEGKRAIEMTAIHLILTSVTAALSTGDDTEATAMTMSKAYRAFVRVNAFEDIQKTKWYHQVHAGKLVLREAAKQSFETPADIEKFKEANAAAIAGHPQIAQLLEQVISHMKVVRSVMLIVDSGLPIQTLKEVAGVASVTSIHEVMRRTPHAKAFTDYVARKTLEEMDTPGVIRAAVPSVAPIAQPMPQLEHPPTLNQLIGSGVMICLQKNAQFTTEVAQILGNEDPNPEMARAMATIKQQLMDKVGQAIFKRMQTLTDVSKYVKEKDGMKTLRTCLAEGYGSMAQPATEVDWDGLIEMVYTKMSSLLKGLIKSYLDNGRVLIQLKARDSQTEVQYTDKRELLWFLVECVLCNQPDFEKRIGGLRIDKAGRKLARSLKPINICVDSVDVDVRVATAKTLVALFEKVVRLVEVYGTTKLFYLAELELDLMHVWTEVNELLSRRLFKKRVVPNAISTRALSKDILYILSHVAGNPRAATLSKFKDTLRNAGADMRRSSFLLDEPEQTLSKISVTQSLTSYDLVSEAVDTNSKVSLWSSNPTFLIDDPSSVTFAKGTDTDECMIVEPPTEAGPNVSAAQEEVELVDIPQINRDCHALFTKMLLEHLKHSEKLTQEEMETVTGNANIVFKKTGATLVYEREIIDGSKKENTKAAHYGLTILQALPEPLTAENQAIVETVARKLGRDSADANLHRIATVLLTQKPLYIDPKPMPTVIQTQAGESVNGPTDTGNAGGDGAVGESDTEGVAKLLEAAERLDEHVAADDVAVAADAVIDTLAEKVPVAAEKVPVATDAVPVAAEKVPVAADVDPAVAEKVTVAADIDPAVAAAVNMAVAHIIARRNKEGSSGGESLPQNHSDELGTGQDDEGNALTLDAAVAGYESDKDNAVRDGGSTQNMDLGD